MLTLDRAAIEARIPHAGRMCLLDAVVAWDATRITCSATSHQVLDHPMARDGVLGGLCAVEYAAQTMAVHGALTGGALTADGVVPKAGYLASLRDIACHVARLDTLAAPLSIVAEQLMGEAGRVIYRFEVRAGATAVLSGRAAVVLEAAG